MDATEYLENIIKEAEAALGHAQAGGDRENAFNLTYNTGDLCAAFETLYDLNCDINDELEA